MHDPVCHGLFLQVSNHLGIAESQVNHEGLFRYASSRWFLQALEVLVESGVHGVAIDVWVRPQLPDNA